MSLETLLELFKAVERQQTSQETVYPGAANGQHSEVADGEGRQCQERDGQGAQDEQDRGNDWSAEMRRLGEHVSLSDDSSRSQVDSW